MFSEYNNEKFDRGDLDLRSANVFWRDEFTSISQDSLAPSGIGSAVGHLVQPEVRAVGDLRLGDDVTAEVVLIACKKQTVRGTVTGFIAREREKETTETIEFLAQVELAQPVQVFAGQVGTVFVAVDELNRIGA